MKRILFCATLGLLGSMNATSVYADSLIDSIKVNYDHMLLTSDIYDKDAEYIQKINHLPEDEEFSDRCIVELYQRQTVTADVITRILSTFKSDGSWSDINYQDKTRSGWKVKEHAERLLPMCRFYRVLISEKKHAEANELLTQIKRGLQYWADLNPISPNWWHNQVGVPKTLGNALVLVWDELSAPLQNQIMEVLFKQHVRFGMTGQNKVWKAGNMLIRALLSNDVDMLKEARNTIASEIKTGQEEGIQKDWSFRQHGAQQQLGNYGLAFVSTMSFYDELFQHTSLAFSDEQRSILQNLIDKGYGWTLWNNHFDVNCLNRQLFRNVATNKYHIVQLTARSLKGTEAATPSGNKYFPSSDMTIHRTSNWMASIKMASNRVIGCEQLNGDNRKGYYTADGATYVYTQGNEYDNIFPLWDWRKIPGITSYQSDEPTPNERVRINRNNQSDFVGGLSDGASGITAMQLNRNGLQAKKFWAFTDNLMVCLGTDIKTDSLPAATTIEQCNATPESRWIECGKNRYLLHDKGYMVLDNAKPVLTVEERTGDWHEIMLTYKSKTVKGHVATMYIEHGMTHNGSYQYAILPNITKKALKKFKSKRIQVLTNTRSMQLVQIDNQLFAAVYEKGQQYETKGGQVLYFPSSGLYLLKKGNNKKAKDKWNQTKFYDPTKPTTSEELN